jgi:serine/threonine protein kinase
VEGETLRDSLTKRALPAERTLDIAKQVFSGRGAAHRSGIVYRGLKPANSMVRAVVHQFA